MTDSIQKLINQPCWGVVAGKGTGSIFNLQIGNKIPRKEPLTNPHLSKEIQNNNSEFSLMVYSSWELLQNDDLICCESDSNENDGPMVNGLKKLINEKITNIQLSDHYHEMTISFTSNFTLEIFCDGNEYGEDYDNYTIFFPTHTYTITSKYEIRKENI